MTLFQNYENIIYEAFSHVLVINDNYMFSFKRILKKNKDAEIPRIFNYKIA
jgi:hypothetical protein